MHFVKMYSAEWCPDCKEMELFLDKHDVAYQVINVDNNAQAVENLKSAGFSGWFRLFHGQ